MRCISCVLAVFLCMSLLAGCSSRDGIVSSRPESVSLNSSQQETISQPPAIPDTSAADLPKQAVDASASFALGWDAPQHKSLQIGDKIGDWTLNDLEITYDDGDNISMLEAIFIGNITLTGSLSTSALAEGGFDFQVAKADQVKMPCYISPDMAPKDHVSFMLRVPEDIASTLQLGENEELACRITISDYQFIFAYMMAPSFATLVSIEEVV